MKIESGVGNTLQNLIPQASTATNTKESTEVTRAANRAFGDAKDSLRNLFSGKKSAKVTPRPSYDKHKCNMN